MILVRRTTAFQLTFPPGPRRCAAIAPSGARHVTLTQTLPRRDDPARALTAYTPAVSGGRPPGRAVGLRAEGTRQNEKKYRIRLSSTCWAKEFSDLLGRRGQGPSREAPRARRRRLRRRIRRRRRRIRCACAARRRGRCAAPKAPMRCFALSGCGERASSSPRGFSWLPRRAARRVPRHLFAGNATLSARRLWRGVCVKGAAVMGGGGSAGSGGQHS